MNKKLLFVGAVFMGGFFSFLTSSLFCAII